MNTSPQWYEVNNINTLDSPALLIYADRVQENIRRVKGMVRDVAMLRPHVKTSKIAEVCQMMLTEGITKFKCATIAEAEMLAGVEAPDVLLAYQPGGPKVLRLLNLVEAFQGTRFSCLVDNPESAVSISQAALEKNMIIDVFLDLNVGMNRTGILPEHALPVAESLCGLKGVNLVGLHAYDGHINDTDLQLRQQKSDAIFQRVLSLKQEVGVVDGKSLKIVIGSSPTFPINALREDVECSPGTFVFWDWGYRNLFPDEPFRYAALVITRVVSIVDEHTICTDLGVKAISAEKPLPRVHFLNAPDAVPSGHSEEHLVVSVPDSQIYHPGDVLYGVPVHVCPTVSLYDIANVVEDGKITTQWEVVARKRMITY